MKTVLVTHAHRERELVEELRYTLRSAGTRLLELVAPPGHRSNIEAEVVSAIHSADAVVAILRRADQRVDANVLIELGFALGAGKPVLIAADSTEDLPAGVLTLPYVRTTGDAHSDAMHIVHRLLDLQPAEPRSHTDFESPEEELRTFETNPTYFESLAPRRFEELLVAWFRARGCVVQLPQDGRDSGYDFAFKPSPTEGLILVEAKKRLPQSRVSVGEVQRLIQAAVMAKAGSAMLISASGFTAAAIGLTERSEVPLSLVTLPSLLEAQSVRELLERREAVAYSRTTSGVS